MEPLYFMISISVSAILNKQIWLKIYLNILSVMFWGLPSLLSNGYQGLLPQ